MQNHGQDVAVLVPIEDLSLLERLEDIADIRAAEAAEAEADRTSARRLCPGTKPASNWDCDP